MAIAAFKHEFLLPVNNIGISLDVLKLCLGMSLLTVLSVKSILEFSLLDVFTFLCHILRSDVFICIKFKAILLKLVLLFYDSNRVFCHWEIFRVAVRLLLSRELIYNLVMI